MVFTPWRAPAPADHAQKYAAVPACTRDRPNVDAAEFAGAHRIRRIHSVYTAGVSNLMSWEREARMPPYDHHSDELMLHYLSVAQRGHRDVVEQPRVDVWVKLPLYV